MKNAVKTKTDLDEREEDVCINIFRGTMLARNLMHEMARTVATRSGLHAAELNVVDILGKFGRMSMGDLSRETFISPSNTTSTVKKLEAAELVKRKRSDQSHRLVSVSLTTRGKTLFRKCYPQILGEAHAHMAQRLTREERAKLASLLQKLVAKK
jgi:MarR family transcriptional regulator, multiple antibiotic resistance protein MarR